VSYKPALSAFGVTLQSLKVGFGQNFSLFQRKFPPNSEATLPVRRTTFQNGKTLAGVRMPKRGN
jgi:hypothetical protein